MKKWTKALMIGAAALAPAAVLAAGIDGTHHDMTSGGVGVSNEKCAYCHAKTGVADDGTTYGTVGGFCVVVCHSAGGGLSGTQAVIPDTPGAYNWAAGAFSMGTISPNDPMNTTTHGRAPGAFPTTDGATAVNDTGWPHTATGVTEYECTSCHAVHDATNPPFLNAALSDGTQDGGFCQRCHDNTGRMQDIAAAGGDHPIEFTWSTATANSRGGTTKTDTTVMGNRELVVGTNITNVNVAATDAGADGSINQDNDHWNMGGHLIDANGLAASAGQFGCYSCHTVHNLDADGGFLAVGASLETICFGCHTTEPGRTNFGHPISPAETTISNGHTWTIPLSTGANGYDGIGAQYLPTVGTAPLCVSCHDVHDASTALVAGTTLMAIRTISATMPESACEQCHISSFASPDGNTDQHHPGQDSAKNYVADDGFPTSAGWLTIDGLGDLNDGLSCPDCHVGDGSDAKRASAHNWN